MEFEPINPEPPSAPEPRTSRRTLFVISAIAVALVVGVVAILAFQGDGSTSSSAPATTAAASASTSPAETGQPKVHQIAGSLILDENFNDATSDFPISDAIGRTMGHAEGGYRIAIQSPQRVDAPYLFAPATGDLTVEADVQLLQQPPVGGAEIHGVGCFDHNGNGYLFGVQDTGNVDVSAIHGGAVEDLQQKQLHFDASSPVHVRAVCQAGTGTAVILHFYVGGKLALKTIDPKGSTSFDMLTLSVETTGTVDVLFDNVKAQLRPSV